MKRVTELRRRIHSLQCMNAERKRKIVDTEIRIRVLKNKLWENKE